MQEFILFIMCFTLILIIYFLFIIRKAKKGDLEKLPTEVKYLKYKYKINVDKSNYKKILNMVGIISSFDISVIVTVTMLFNNFLLQILVIMILSPIIFLLTYHIYGLSLKEGDN